MKQIFIDVKPIIKLLPAVLLLFLVALSGCERNRVLDVVHIEQGYLNRQLNDTTSLVITTLQERDMVVETLDLPKLKDSNIDFSAYMLLAVFEKNNSTSTVDITKVEETKNNIIVSFENLQKGITNDVGTIYHIVRVAKSSKPAIFNKINN